MNNVDWDKEYAVRLLNGEISSRNQDGITLEEYLAEFNMTMDDLVFDESLTGL
jgi:hypothetical protein